MLKKAQSSIRLSDSTVRNFILITNVIQTIYQKSKNTRDGLLEAKKILDAVNSLNGLDERNNITWKGLASIDIASMLVDEGKFAEAETYAKSGHEQFILLHNKYQTDYEAEFNALMVLIQVKIDLNKIADANNLLQRADEVFEIIIKNKDNFFQQIPYYRLKARLAELKGEYKNAVLFSRKMNIAQDSLKRRNDVLELKKINQRIEAQNFKNKLAIIESEKNFQRWMIGGVLIIMILLGIIAKISLSKLKTQHQLLESQLDLARHDIENYAKGFKEKSELTEKLKAEIEKMNSIDDKSSYYEQLMQSTILTNDDWTKFKVVFERVYPNYISKQLELFPDLTQAEIRYLVLSKLNLSTNEMANMLSVSDGAIRKLKSRLKEKLNPATGTSEEGTV